MTIEHDAIPNADLHEPKGISAASDGDTYVADGLGSGTWQQPGGALFGAMHFNGNTVPTSIAADSPTPGDGNAVLLSGANLTTPGALFVQSVSDTIVFDNTGNNERLIVPIDGVYELSTSISFSGGGGGGGNVYRTCFAINGVEQGTSAGALRQTSSSNIGNMSVSQYFSLSANDTVQPIIANQNASNNPTVSSASFTCILIKAT